MGEEHIVSSEQGHFWRNCLKLKEKKGKRYENSPNIIDINDYHDSDNGVVGEVLCEFESWKGFLGF